MSKCMEQSRREFSRIQFQESCHHIELTKYLIRKSVRNLLVVYKTGLKLLQYFHLCLLWYWFDLKLSKVCWKDNLKHMGLTRQTKYIIFHIKPQSVQLMYETMSSEKVFKHELANFQSLFCPLNSFYGSAFISVPT